MTHGASKQTFLDGGIHFNNPIEVADRERKLIWPSVEELEPDVVVSIGTSYNEAAKEISVPKTARPRGMLANIKFLKKMAVDQFAFPLDSERTWRLFHANKTSSSTNSPYQCGSKYFRLNPVSQQDPPRLDAVDKMKDLRSLARNQFENNPVIKTLARQLVASCFYFEPFSHEGDQNQNMIGGLHSF